MSHASPLCPPASFHLSPQYLHNPSHCCHHICHWPILNPLITSLTTLLNISQFCSTSSTWNMALLWCQCLWASPPCYCSSVLECNECNCHDSGIIVYVKSSHLCYPKSIIIYLTGTFASLNYNLLWVLNFGYILPASDHWDSFLYLLFTLSCLCML